MQKVLTVETRERGGKEEGKMREEGGREGGRWGQRDRDRDRRVHPELFWGAPPPLPADSEV